MIKRSTYIVDNLKSKHFKIINLPFKPDSSLVQFAVWSWCLHWDYNCINVCISSRICRALHLIAEYKWILLQIPFYYRTVSAVSLLMTIMKCLIVKLLNQKLEGAWTKVHILNHPGSTFSCILMSVVGMPLLSAGPNAECGSVHIIMHLQPNTSCPPSPAQPSPAQPSSSLDSINPIQSRWSAASSLLPPIRITMGEHCDKQINAFYSKIHPTPCQPFALCACEGLCSSNFLFSEH